MYYIEKFFLQNIKKDSINVIFELGSRDLLDAFKLITYYDNSIIYSFECNPECLIECEENLSLMKDYIKDRIILVKQAVSENNGDVSFYPFFQVFRCWIQIKKSFKLVNTLFYIISSLCYFIFCLII